MKGSIQHLTRQSAFYALGNVTVKLGGLLLAPLLLNPTYLDVRSYGYLALMLVTAQLGVYVSGLGVSSGLLRFWTHPDYRDRRDALATTALVVCVIVGTLIPVAIYVGLSDVLARHLLDDVRRTDVIGWILAYAGFKIVGSVPLTVYRVQERPFTYGAIQILEVVLLVVLGYYWLVVQGLGLEGIVMAYAVAAGITAAVSCIVAFAPVHWSLQPRIAWPMVSFGAPLALASVSAWILNSSDRYLLKWLSDPTVIASYDWASRVAGIINVLLVQSFQLAFVVVGLRHLDDNDVTLHREMFRHYVVWTGWAVLGLAAFTNDAMGLTAVVFSIDRAYVDISGLVFLVGIGFWFYGINQIVSSILTSAGRTGVVALCVGLAAFLNVILNLFLIPVLGGTGAAVATALAFLALTATTTIFAERRISVGYEWSLPASVLLIIIGLFLLSELTQGRYRSAGIWLRIAAVGAYVPLLVITGRYRISEFRNGFRTVLRIVTLRSG